MRHNISLIAVGFVALLCSCGSERPRPDLEVTARYNSSNPPHCSGEVKNVSRRTFHALEIHIEFQNSDGNRVRTNAASVLAGSLAPATSGGFSVPYLKGSNDPPVVKCKVIEVVSSDGERVLFSRQE